MDEPLQDEPLQDEPSLTEQLRRFSGGDRQIAEAVLRKVLPELHRIALREINRRFDAPALSPTELINELWLRSLRRGGWRVDSRQHFYSTAALAMRQVLVDYARNRVAKRRGEGKEPLPLSSNIQDRHAVDGGFEQLVVIGLLMERLEKRDPEAARVVDMHYFAGFTLEEIADITGMTVRQVRHRWERGRDKLKDRLAAQDVERRNGIARE